MKVTVRLWAQMRMLAGADRFEMILPDGALVSDALREIYRSHPELLPHRDSARAAVGTRYASGDEALIEGDELSLIPPVQGGSGPW